MLKIISKPSSFNKILGLIVLGLGLGVNQTIINQNNDMYLYNREKYNKIQWVYPTERNKMFNSTFLFACGGLGMLVTGQIFWGFPGVIALGTNAISNYKRGIDIDRYN